MNERYSQIVSSMCNGKHLLEYGCGTGSGSLKWLQAGARLTGIDISSEGIRKARENIQKSGFRAEYFVMNAENTDFPQNNFDIVVGTGILHHLDLKLAYSELSRILKADGHIIFSEPMGHNPVINLYRKITPKMRTKNEHPLKQADINLLKEYFHNVESDYFSLMTLAAVPFRNTFVFDTLYGLLRKVDQFLFQFSFLRRQAWFVIIHAYNPKKLRTF